MRRRHHEHDLVPPPGLYMKVARRESSADFAEVYLCTPDFFFDLLGVRHREAYEDIRLLRPIARDQIRKQAHTWRTAGGDADPAGPICLCSGCLRCILDEAENPLGVAHELLSGVRQLEPLPPDPEKLDADLRPELLHLQ